MGRLLSGSAGMAGRSPPAAKRLLAMPSPRSPRAGKRKQSRALDVATLLAACDEVAPFRLAADWDNVGLIAGRDDWAARKILLAIDLTDAVAREAIGRSVDALVV